jgi:hypothetical protein
MYNNKTEIFLKTNKDGTREIVVSDVVKSPLANFTGISRSHIFSHELNKVVCDSKSHWWGGLNNDLNIELLKEIGIEKIITCKRCRAWFKTNYL